MTERSPSQGKLRQVGALYAAMILTIVLGFITSVINTRALGPEDYGNFKFINNLFQFLFTISTLGLFYTGAQVIAKLGDDDPDRNEIIGTLIVLSGMISACLVLLTIIFAFLEPIIFGNDLSITLIWSSPIVVGLVFQGCFQNILQGENRIFQLSLLRLLPSALFVVVLVVVNYVLELDLVITLLIQLITTLCVTAVSILWLKPRYTHFKAMRRMLWAENNKYGWHVYIGVLSNVSTAYLSTFMISYYLDNTNVGFFSLAQTLTMPLATLASVVGTTYFKDFATSIKLPRKVTIATSVLAGLAMLIFIMIIRPVVLAVYTEKFEQVALLAAVMAGGSTMQGIGDYFNRFLGAHGRGKELRNGAFVVGGVNVIGYIVLIKIIGVEGAAITKLFAGMMYCMMMVFYYRKCVKMLAGQGSAPVIQ